MSEYAGRQPDLDDLPDPSPTHGIESLSLIVLTTTTLTPSKKYGAVGGVIGLRLTPIRSWVRLHPVSWQLFGERSSLHPGNVITVNARRARPTSDTWRPAFRTIRRIDDAAVRERYQRHLAGVIGHPLCGVTRPTRAERLSRITLIQPAALLDAQIDEYPQHSAAPPTDHRPRQLGLDDDQLCAQLRPPRFTVTYHYRCRDQRCAGHRHVRADPDVLAFQRERTGVSDRHLRRALFERFYRPLCQSVGRLAFLVGPRPGRRGTLGILAVHRRT